MCVVLTLVVQKNVESWKLEWLYLVGKSDKPVTKLGWRILDSSLLTTGRNALASHSCSDFRVLVCKVSGLTR